MIRLTKMGRIVVDSLCMQTLSPETDFTLGKHTSSVETLVDRCLPLSLSRRSCCCSGSAGGVGLDQTALSAASPTHLPHSRSFIHCRPPRPYAPLPSHTFFLLAGEDRRCYRHGIEPAAVSLTWTTPKTATDFFVEDLSILKESSLLAIIRSTQLGFFRPTLKRFFVIGSLTRREQ